MDILNKKKKVDFIHIKKKINFNNIYLDDGRISPDNKCPICLGKIDDKSYANKCFHYFCRTCLYEWSKVKKDCPVCRQPFDKLIVNVKSDDDYEEQDLNIVDEFFYRSCNRYLSLIDFQSRFNRVESSLISPQTSSTVNLGYAYDNTKYEAGSISHRRYIYRYDYYVLPYGNGNNQRTRQVTSCFYKRNPACIHRLVPFLNLELKALILNRKIRDLLCNLILKKLPVVDINSSKFEKLLLPYLNDRTVHFIHEFYNFARSCYDFNEYFNIAVYVPKKETQLVAIKKEEKINLENPTCSSTFNRLFKNKFAPEKTLNEVNSSSSDSEIELLCETKLKNNDLQINQQQQDDNPKPGPSGLQNSNLKINYIQQNYTEDSDSDFDDYEPKNQKYKLPFLESDDDESVEIIDVLKPRHLRTPELVELTEDEDQEQITNETASNIDKEKNESDITETQNENYFSDNLLNFNFEIKKTKNSEIDENYEYNQQNKVAEETSNSNLLTDSSNSFHNHQNFSENNQNCKVKRLASVIVNLKNEHKKKICSNQNYKTNCSSTYSSNDYFTKSQSDNLFHMSSSSSSIPFKNDSLIHFHNKVVLKRNRKIESQFSKETNMKIIKQINNAVNNTFNRLPSIIGSQSSTLKKLNQNSFLAIAKPDDESK